MAERGKIEDNRRVLLNIFAYFTVTSRSLAMLLVGIEQRKEIGCPVDPLTRGTSPALFGLKSRIELVF